MSAEEQIDNLSKELEEVILGEDGKPLSKKALKKLEKEREKEKRKQEVAARLALEKAQREANVVDYGLENYGKLPMNQSQNKGETEWTRVRDLNKSKVGQTVDIQGRVQGSRPTGSKMCFLVVREGSSTVQGVVCVDSDQVSKQMVKYADSIPVESLVMIKAEVVAPEEEVLSCTVKDVELRVKKLFIISEAVARIPFSMEDATRGEEQEEKEGVTSVRVNLDTRLDNRVIDLRTITNNAIFRIQAAVGKLFREFLDTRDFVEIHSPKIIGAASEGGANVFEVSYFKRSAYLAQSPQLYKQMCISADFGKVYEIAPVFRAENSNTHRHLTEFVGLDLEMGFREHYHEVMFLIGELFLFIFAELEKRYSYELEVVRSQYPFEPFKFSDKPLRLEFKDAVALLREAGVAIEDYEDLSTENERLLGRLVREKFDTDFYMLDKFPSAIRPFYTMPDAQNPLYSNSYDFFIRGEEVMSGAQRIHDAAFLEKRALECGVDIESIKDYIDAFKYGCPPHAGGGVGLERVVMLYLNLGNIRRTSLFPRDPRRIYP
ncbi:Aspartate-tRNA ligase, cytoplasmic [Zancudomyces culisetae]|uniref:Aspartate--tRNA ligase, cytoplasmic n=1 Tax=Zancudomyces culisetae TaxID=1213189 RepID=A0A1R1PRH8_ZANCU|nr:Aspartate-tRNA ligase, cytoplasmic [Zancudomyces culisetae]OMH83549.1 Aspartate-tRNA ligase, cytoplasmic [Zancudomyces culisetae]|eukprot:OMH79904.1 Aspartate-tRNA ligase, cytoplasmic [Zancudomyces culisetae]